VLLVPSKRSTNKTPVFLALLVSSALVVLCPNNLVLKVTSVSLRLLLLRPPITPVASALLSTSVPPTPVLLSNVKMDSGTRKPSKESVESAPTATYALLRRRLCALSSVCVTATLLSLTVIFVTTDTTLMKYLECLLTATVRLVALLSSVWLLVLSDSVPLDTSVSSKLTRTNPTSLVKPTLVLRVLTALKVLKHLSDAL
jgi:hypothetical protein